MNYLGIDYGTKRIGVAVGNDANNIAFPREVLVNNKETLLKIGEYIRTEDIDEIVLGESNNLDGTPNPIMEKIKSFADVLKLHYNIPIHFEPEVYTSKEAGLLQGKNKMLDASAASLILNSFLMRQKHKKGDSDTYADIYESVENI